MIRAIAREALKTSVVPILVGDGLKARLLAAKVFMKYGVHSVICDEKQSAWRFVVGFGGFYKIIRTHDPRLLCEELERISELSAGGVLIIAPCSNIFSDLVSECEREIEKRFVIAKPNTLLDKIYPDN